MSQAYEMVSAYHQDLRSRYDAREQWKARHPDWESKQFQDDVDLFYKTDENNRNGLVFASSFDPQDTPPNTADIFTVELLLNIMEVSLQAWEKHND